MWFIRGYFGGDATLQLLVTFVVGVLIPRAITGEWLKQLNEVEDPTTRFLLYAVVVVLCWWPGMWEWGRRRYNVWVAGTADGKKMMEVRKLSPVDVKKRLELFRAGEGQR